MKNWLTLGGYGGSMTRRSAAILRQALEIESARIGSDSTGNIESLIAAGETGLAKEFLLQNLEDRELEPLDPTVALLAQEAAVWSAS